MMHPPSRRRENARQRERSLPRSSDKLKQDLLSLITEPAGSQPGGQKPAYSNRKSSTSLNKSKSSAKTDSTDDDLSPRKFNHEHLTEADRQFAPMLASAATPCTSSVAKPIQIGSRSQRNKSSSDPITDERLHRIEKTLREMQIKLDEVCHPKAIHKST